MVKEGPGPSGEFYYQFKQRTSGLFVELAHRTEVTLPAPRGKSFVRLAQHGGSLTLSPVPGRSDAPRKWRLEVGGLDELVLRLDPGAPTKLIHPPPLPPPLAGHFFQSGAPDEWRTGGARAALVLEFEFGSQDPPEVRLETVPPTGPSEPVPPQD